MQLPRLAWRNFSRHLNRYRVLLLALTLVVAVLVIVLGAVTGMQETLRDKASRYFAGNVVVFGYMDGGESLIEDPEQIDALLDEAGVSETARSWRSTFYSPGDSTLFHAGYYMPQRRFVGVEWERERPVLERFDFASGAVPEAGDERAILISTATAEELNASVGDELTVSTTTDAGAANTVPLVVRGIFRESTFFGYSAYLERTTLNRLLDRSEGQVNEIGIYFDGGAAEERRV
ncbi:MAG: ABC transporter permease, partial [Spirochaetales bacterium]